MTIRFLQPGPAAHAGVRIQGDLRRIRNLRAPFTSRGKPADEKPLPRWRTIALDLEERIALGDLAHGERLPTEAAIAARHGVARQTVRHAIANLAQRGLVRCTPGIGAFVSSPRLTYSINDDARFFENVMRAGRRPGNRILSVEETFAPAEVTAWLQLARRARVLELRHVGTANDIPICVSTSWFPADRCARIGEYFARTSSFSHAFRFIGIPAIHRKMTRVTARLADARDRELLNVRTGAIVSVIEALYADGKGEPVQATYASFPSEAVEIVVGR